MENKENIFLLLSVLGYMTVEKIKEDGSTEITNWKWDYDLKKPVRN